MSSHSDRTPAAWRRALSHWLGRTTPAPAATADAGPAVSDPALPAAVGHYAILRKIGQGGMGIVYAARDERLQRTVALKTMAAVGPDETARRRFWREARAAASVNHPNICQIHEIGEDAGTLFIAMELLDGESLADRLGRGPLLVTDAVPLALGMLTALGALHARGLVHRDLKPSNVFLTAHGVKLLDFGLARPELDAGAESIAGMTQSGVIVGTPRYMAPEQATGDAVDARSDLFAAGAILFEMLAGRPAFNGRTVVDVLHATLHEQPPALSGSPAVAAVDRVIRRALAKRPADRFPSAESMIEELRDLPSADGDGSRALARPLTRIVVLPLRVLRPDAETDFLAFSLPDAISTSLAGVPSMIVRSTAVAARFAGEAPDLKALAADVDVDRVLMGTLLRAGDQVRVTAQLVEAPSGTLLSSLTIQSPLGDLFALQDHVARQVVEALSLPTTGEVRSPVPDAPRNPRAYELYLRANQLARAYPTLPEARDLYVRALELDPTLAAAWAHLGRCHRVIGKYLQLAEGSDALARDAFERALALEPRLSVAHKFYANFEADTGEALRGMVRLLDQASRHGNDPELFAGLVQTCRYCGLADESLAAHAEARRLDPHIGTSVLSTLFSSGQLDRLLAIDEPPDAGGGDEGLRVIGLGLSGRREEAVVELAAMRERVRVQAFKAWTDYIQAWLDRRPDRMRSLFSEIGGLTIQDDPEALFMEGWLLCDAGDPEAGLGYLQRAVTKGYWAAQALERAHHFDVLRGDPAFREMQAAAAEGRRRALAAFREHGGEALLGCQPSAA